MVHPGYRKRTILLLIALLLVRFWFGQTFELSGQEAYLWMQGHAEHLSPAYWHNGPMVPVLIRIGTMFFGDTELGVRWLAAVICSGSGFVLFYLARRWFDARTAFWTVVLYVVLPMFAWKLSFMTEAAAGIGLMALAMLAFSCAIETNKGAWWLLGGAACGMGLLVAVSNVLWLVGVVLYCATHPVRRERLREMWVWVTVIFTALFLTPLIWWWRGSQVSDVAHQRIASAWPLSHGFSFNQGFHFIGLELYYLSPLFFLLLVFVLTKMGRQVWSDTRFGLMLWLALPSLVWQNFSAFFHEGLFDLIPPLCLPLVLLVGCQMGVMLATNRNARWVATGVIGAALLQTLAGLNPFFYGPTGDGHGREWQRSRSGENLSSIYPTHSHISWRNLADTVQNLQQSEGATLLIADSARTASALSFYLPRNQFVYVEGRPGVITQFDFWTGYAQSASPNDSALFIAQTTNPEHPADGPGPEIVKDFATVKQIDDSPLPDLDRSWDIWNCQNFIGGEGDNAREIETKPMRESEALPK